MTTKIVRGEGPYQLIYQPGGEVIRINRYVCLDAMIHDAASLMAEGVDQVVMNVAGKKQTRTEGM